MSIRTMAKLAIISLVTWQIARAQPGKENEGRTQMNNRESSDAMGQSQTRPATRAKAKAKVTVQNSEATPFDQTANPALMEIHLTETFTGDIDGESPVRALQVLRDDHSASFFPGQPATIPRKIGRTPGHLRAPRFRNRRERQDQSDLVCRSPIRDC